MSVNRRCPQGAICIENYAAFFAVVCIALVCYAVFKTWLKPKQNIIINNTASNKSDAGGWLPSWPYFNDPLQPPLRDERYPINIPTNIGAVDTTYRQVGILTPLNGKNDILQLMGRPLIVTRDMWQYYTISNQHNNVKLPVSNGGKSCTNEYGCNKFYEGDTAYVSGSNEVYKVTLYDNSTIRYLPFM